ncbi:MAG: transposase [Caldilineaceae bacterium SB0665_bin_21]|nr:transposase [Caldilineaceae bacterium SB0665_bin_21]
MRSWVVKLSSCPHRIPLHSPSAMARHALCTHEFKVLLRLLQQDPAVRVGSHRDLRRFLHGVHYLLHTGIPWRDLPRRFGHWNSLFRRYRRGCLAGVWERLAAACAEARKQECRVHLDTTHVRSHPASAGARRDQGGQEAQAQGLSRAGTTASESTSPPTCRLTITRTSFAAATACWATTRPIATGLRFSVVLFTSTAVTIPTSRAKPAGPPTTPTSATADRVAPVVNPPFS